MPTNREILYTIRVRNQAAAALRQVTADLAAQGTTVQRVARDLAQFQAAATRTGAAAAQAARGTGQLTQTAKDMAAAAKGVATLSKAMGDASAKAGTFKALGDAVDGLDRTFRTSAGLGVYRARLQALQSTLAALTADFHAASTAAVALSGAAPPRAPRGTGTAGAPPAGTAPPSGGGSNGSGGSGSSGGQQGFNAALTDTRGKLDELRSRLTQVAALTVSAFGARKVLDYADAYTQLIGQLKLVTSGTQNLEQAYAALYGTAQANSTSLDATVNLYSRFTKATNTLGVSQREVIEVTDAVNKAISIFGGNAQSAEAALVQFSQGLASGTLRGEELNSVLEQAPRLAQAIADGMKNDAGGIGIPLGSLRAYAEQGKLTTEAVFRALQNQRPKLQAESETMGLTIGKAFTQARNAAVDFIGKADQASGASKRVAEAIVGALKGLQTPQAISAAQTALSAFSGAVSGALSGVALLASNLQLAVTGFVAFKTITIFGPALAAMGASAASATSQLLVYSVATRSVAIGASAANIAVRGLNIAMASFGGPVGLAITAGLTVATTALSYWLTSTKSSVTTTNDLSEATDKLRGAYDATTNSLKGLTDAEKARRQLQLEGIAKDLSGELSKQAKSLNSALAPGLFEGTDGSRLAQRFMPFRAEIEAFRQSVRDGKADFDGLQKGVAIKAKADPALADAAREIDTAAEAGRKAQESFGQTSAQLRMLGGAATDADAKLGKLTDTLATPRPVDGAAALVGFVENLKAIGANVPVLERAQEAQNKLTTAQGVVEQAQRNLSAAFQAGTIGLGEYEARQLALTTTWQRARDAINGITQAQRDLRDAERDLGANVLVDRAKAVEDLNIKYDRLIRAKREELTTAASTQDGAQLAETKAKVEAVIAGYERMRGVEIGQLDTRFQNNDLRDRILSLQTEGRLLGLTGVARERAAALLDVESAARRAGVANVDGMVAAYAKEYDALQKAKDARQTMGDGFNTAVTKYLEDAKRVGDQSAQMFRQVFDHISDGFVDVIRTGKDGFKSLLDNLANDLLRFASRQLFRTLLSSLFGDGQGGAGSGGGALGGLGASLLSGLGGKAASATGTGATAIAQTATAVSGLSKAATEATSSFGDIPGKLTTMLKGLGATDAGVAGFLGNVKAESGFKTDAVNPSSGAYGLIQALGSRKTELFRQYGANPSADQQVAFIRSELQTTEAATLKRLQSAGTLEDGVKAGIGFERPEGYVAALKAGDLSQVPDYATRLGYARGFTGSGGSSPYSLEGATLSSETVTKLQTDFDSIGRTLDKADVQILNGVDGISTGLTAGGSQLGKAFSDVSLDVSNSGNGLVSALSNVAGKLGGGSWSLGDLFGSGATAGAAAGGLNPSSFVAGMHTGGLVGRGSTYGFTKSASVFDGAPRFHTGGIVGLGHKETPIIAKDDEAVFPTVRMSDGNFGIRATGLTGGGGGGGASFVMGDINVQAPPRSADPAADQEYSKAIGREIKEQVRGVVTEMLHEQSRGGGMLRKP